jgi:hypothetical protein
MLAVVLTSGFALPPAAERIPTVRDPRNILIAVLVIAVAVLGYLYYESQQHRISVNLPGFKLDAK